MKYRYRWTAVFIFWAIAFTGFADEPPFQLNDLTLSVSTRGQFVHPQTYQVVPGARLAAVANSWQLAPNAYRLGIALLRADQQRLQSRLRWALLYQLTDAKLDPETHRSLRDQVTQFVATGRVLRHFDWDVIELSPENNRPLKYGDVFVAPHRPDSIRVAGAVRETSLAYEPSKSVADYMAQIERLPGNDPSYVWVITPDTAIRRIGISYWNEQKAYLAPGSVLYVPLKSGFTQKYPEFNQSMMQLYAAQVLPQ